jgi:hypothetical protein
MNIVFAHFNTPIPKHLKLNLVRTYKLFPNHKIYLITNLKPKSLKNIDVNIFHYNHGKNWDLLQNQLKHDAKFRGNFWFTSTARFLAFSDFARLHKGDFLHLESDVIISKDFPFNLISKSKSLIQFPIVSDSLAIASCLYIKNLKAANFLANVTMTQALRDDKTTDMHILREISKDKKSGFGILPTAPSASESMPEVGEKFLKSNSESISYYKGVFDGFNIGRYLFGDDPRNKRGFTKLRHVDVNNYLNVIKLKFSMNNSRDFPLIYDFESKKHIPIFALHIHSKKLALFEIQRGLKIIRRAVEKSDAPTKIIFLPTTFFKSIKKSLMRRAAKLISF